VLLRVATVEGIVQGRVDRVYRRWNSPKAKAGGRQRTPLGELAIDAVTPIELDGLSDADAVASGHPDLVSLREELDRREGTVYRIDLHFAGADPRIALRAQTDLSAEEWDGVRASLARKDRDGAWTGATLRLIAERPGTRAVELAEALGLDKPTFKRRVRQLKELGLTISLERGYELSPRGRALLDRDQS